MERKTLLKVFEEMNKIKDADIGKNYDDLTREAVQWYMQNAIQIYSETYKVSPGNIKFKKRLLTHSIPDYASFPRYSGRMYTFQYQPESTSTDRMDYWDMFPLILKINEAEEKRDSFLGINLHYMYPERRMKMMLSLMEKYLSGDISEKNSRISYLDITKLATPPNRYGRVCIRRYKYENIRGRSLMIPPEHWMKMIFLPTYQFVGARSNKVWKDIYIKYLNLKG